MFVCLANGEKEATSKLVRSVTYVLDETFSPSTITLVEAPFLLSRVGYEEFEIGVEIKFWPHLNLPAERLTYTLVFDPTKSTHGKNLILERPRKGVAKKVAKKAIWK